MYVSTITKKKYLDTFYISAYSNDSKTQSTLNIQSLLWMIILLSTIGVLFSVIFTLIYTFIYMYKHI